MLVITPNQSCYTIKGDVATDLPVSASAKKYIMDALTSTAGKRESRKKIGVLNFGYRLITPAGNDAKTGMTFQDNAYIDLGSYNEDGSQKNFKYNGVPVRAQNLARVFEHEWIGHILNHITSDGPERRWADEPGPVESIINGFRREIGLENFQSLNYGTDEGQFKFFGNPSAFADKDIKAQMKAAYLTLFKDYYRFLLKGDPANPPEVPFKYVFNIPVKSR